MGSEDTGASWRDSARTPRFFFMDALAAFPLFLLVWFRLWTVITAFVCILFFVVLERFKFTVPVFMRWLRSFFAGPLRIAKPWWRT